MMGILLAFGQQSGTVPFGVWRTMSCHSIIWKTNLEQSVVDNVLFVGKLTKIRGLRSIIVFLYYKYISNSEHSLKPLKIEEKYIQKILCYKISVHAKEKYFIFLPY